MTFKEKLIELLKTCNEVKTAMEKLEFGSIVWGYISDILYAPNGGNGGGYGGETIYRRMIYVNENYSIPLDKELFLRSEVDDGVDENGYEAFYDFKK